MAKRSKLEQERRNKLAKKLREIRLKAKTGKLTPWLLSTGLFTCRSCWKLVPVKSLKYRVCTTCRLGKEGTFETVVSYLVAAGIEQMTAEIETMKEVF